MSARDQPAIWGSASEKTTVFPCSERGEKGLQANTRLCFVLWLCFPPELSDPVPRGRWQLGRLGRHRVTIVSAEMDTGTHRQSSRGLRAPGAAPSPALGCGTGIFSSPDCGGARAAVVGKQETLVAGICVIEHFRAQRAVGPGMFASPSWRLQQPHAGCPCPSCFSQGDTGCATTLPSLHPSPPSRERVRMLPG